MAELNICKECKNNKVYAKGLCRNCYSRREYNKKRFYNYVIENYAIDSVTERMLNNILFFICESYVDKNEQCRVLCDLLENTIGLSNAEITKVYM